MKKILLIICFLVLSLNIFSQVSDSTTLTKSLLNYYLTSIDSNYITIDTFISDFSVKQQYSEIETMDNDKIFIFYQTEKLLVIVDKKTYKPTFKFLTFLQEEGFGEYVIRDFVSEIGDMIYVHLKRDNNNTKTIFSIQIIPSNNKSLIETFLVKKNV